MPHTVSSFPFTLFSGIVLGATLRVTSTVWVAAAYVVEESEVVEEDLEETEGKR